MNAHINFSKPKGFFYKRKNIYILCIVSVILTSRRNECSY